MMLTVGYVFLALIISAESFLDRVENNSPPACSSLKLKKNGKRRPFLALQHNETCWMERVADSNIECFLIHPSAKLTNSSRCIVHSAFSTSLVLYKEALKRGSEDGILQRI